MSTESGAERRAGVYSHNDHLYLLLGLCRRHENGDEFIAYIPLRTEPEWSGTARIALRVPEDFDANFTWTGERQP